MGRSAGAQIEPAGSAGPRSPAGRIVVDASGTGRLGRCDFRPTAVLAGAEAGSVVSATPARPTAATVSLAARPTAAAPAAAVAAPASAATAPRPGRVAAVARPDGSAAPESRAAASTAPASSAGRAIAASYSGTVPKTGSPADAASERAAASPETIDSRRLLTTASRESSRKFIRDVAIRDPYGTTSATFVPGAFRIRDAADVISSSTSR